MTKPIRPSEVTKKVPNEVIEAFNELIEEHWKDEHVTVYQEAVVDRILLKMPHIKRPTIFDAGWLDVESIYQKAGWEVVFEKPGYNERGKAHFIFSPDE